MVNFSFPVSISPKVSFFSRFRPIQRDDNTYGDPTQLWGLRTISLADWIFNSLIRRLSTRSSLTVFSLARL